ncbi:MAG: hypothetical protein WA989_01045 [Henriciella sp.]|uniref:hypothetical protein n=1 Tax=Henriciella sp. TaxID=1968823 RepID=UPI003C728129
MPLQNRVDPFGYIHAVSERGTFMGNRGGCFHRPDQTLKPTHWASRQWIICQLEFKGRQRELMQPGLYTELFFLDEVTALTAGHRPCYECRRERANAFRDALMARAVFSERPRAAALNDAIAGEAQARLKGKTAPEFVSARDLPDGAMFAVDDNACAVWRGQAYPWSFQGYGPARELPGEPVQRLTPQVTVEALHGGYAPDFHESISRLAGSRSAH